MSLEYRLKTRVAHAKRASQTLHIDGFLAVLSQITPRLLNLLRSHAIDRSHAHRARSDMRQGHHCSSTHELLIPSQCLICQPGNRPDQLQ